MKKDLLSKRDSYVDYLRGIAIVWVVLVHVFYHKQVVPPTLPDVGPLGEMFKTVMLFEMPLLFFVSGAGLYYAHEHRVSVGAFLGRRLRRLLFPYALLAATCITLFYVKALANGEPLSLDQVVSWLLLQPWPAVPVYVGFSMWFVRVMLAVTVIHLVLIRLFLSDRYRAPTAFLLAAAIVAFTPFEKPTFYNAVPLNQLPQYTVFYGAFVYLGYYYASDILPVGRAWLALSGVVSAAALAVLAAAGFVYADGQLNKFPPNLGYGLLGVSWLAFWLMLRPAVVAVVALSGLKRALHFYSSHSYTIFLYHGFGFIAADFLLPILRVTDALSGAHYAVWVLVYFAFALAFATLVAVVIDGGQGLVARALDHSRMVKNSFTRGRYGDAIPH